MAQEQEIRRIRSHLRRREGLLWIRIAVMITAGMPLSLFAPLLLGTVLWAVGLWSSALFAAPSLSVRWWRLFAPLAIILTPWVYYLEGRSARPVSKGLAGDADAKTPPGGPPTAGRAGEVETTGAAAVEPVSSSAGVFEVFLVGSRMVISALRKIRTARRLGADRDRAVLIVRQLIAQEKGLQMSRLLFEGEEIDDIQSELAYLAFHQWIDIGKKRDRVWLYSAARHTLES